MLHYFRVMKRELRNVTITLENELARRARIEAARLDTSLSQFLSNILKERFRDDDAYDSAMNEALARKPFLKTDGKYFSREEVHERSRFRG